MESQMDPNYKFPGSPGTPLFHVSPERVNQQRRDSVAGTSPSIGGGHSRDSSVFEKVAKFDSLATQSKALERKANDAALKRAMVGREEAESEMRRYREEARTLRKQVEEGGARERKVGERLEAVMENYGRAKETHAHTQALWEKEIRRARKESFRSQSVVVKLQEELKAARNALRTSEWDIEQEKERSKMREQEAFAARYQLVGVQEELAVMIEKVKLIEQERDALKTIAKNEEIARIAAEGHIPLPSARHDDEEFASPRKASNPLPAVSIMSSASSEEELEELKRELAWERRRADRAHEHAEHLQLECQFKSCSCRLAEKKGETFDYTTLSSIPPAAVKESKIKYENEHSGALYAAPPWEPQTTVFDPAQGIFRRASPSPGESPWISPAKPQTTMHSHTPSYEPPPAATTAQEVNTSLLSLIDAASPSTASDASEDTTATTIIHHHPHHHDAPSHDYFHTISTTTRIPLAPPAALAARVANLTPPFSAAAAAMAAAIAAEDALSPTMSREEALAQIRERRGRARSLAQGMVTPKKAGHGGARDFSAPAVRSVGRSNVVR